MAAYKAGEYTSTAINFHNLLYIQLLGTNNL